MSLPIPKPKESMGAFVLRFMGNPIMKAKYPVYEHLRMVAYHTYRNHRYNLQIKKSGT